MPPDGSPSTDAERRCGGGAVADLLGAVLVVAGLGWLLFVGRATGTSPRPVVAVLLLVVATYTVARLLSAWWPRLGPTLVAAVVSAVVLSASRPPGGSAGWRWPTTYPNASGALLALAAATVTVALLRWRSRVLAWTVPLVGVAAMVLVLRTGSAAAAVIVGTASVAGLVGRRATRMTWLVPVVAIACLATTAWLGVRFTGAAPATAFEAYAYDGLSTRRIALWHDAIAIGREHPVVGIGFGAFDSHSPTAADPDTSVPHNGFLHAAVEGGAPALVLLLLLVAWTAWRLGDAPVDRATAVALGALVGITAQASIDYVLHFPQVPAVLAALVGAVGVTTAPMSPRAGGSPG